MEIETFVKNELKEVLDLGDLSSTEVKVFDDLHPLFGISDEDVSVLSGERGARSQSVQLDMMSTLMKIDFNNYLQSGIAHQIATDIENAISFHETMPIESHILEGMDRLKQLLSRNPYRGIFCLRMDGWVRILIFYAALGVYKRPRLYIPSESPSFGREILKLIRRYYYSLYYIKKHNNRGFALPKELEYQMTVLRPFVYLYSKNKNDAIHSSDFFDSNNKLLHRLCISLNETDSRQRSDTYSLIQATSYPNSTLSFSICNVSTPIEIYLGKRTGGNIVYKLSEDEFTSIISSKPCEVLDNLKTTVTSIYDNYVKLDSKQWENRINNKRVRCGDYYYQTHLKSWTSIFFEELRGLTIEKGNTDIYKEQLCFYNLISSLVNMNVLKKIEIDSQLLGSFVYLIYHNKSKVQTGLYEKLYTINYLLTQINPEEVKQICDGNNLASIKDVENKLEIVDEMIEFLSPIMNNTFVNEDIISLDNFKKMIKTILLKREFLLCVSKVVPNIFGKNYNIFFNFGLLMNIIGMLCDLNVIILRGQPRILKEKPLHIYHELVQPFGLGDDKNYNRFLTQYRVWGTNYCRINKSMEGIILNEMKERKYYKAPKIINSH